MPEIIEATREATLGVTTPPPAPPAEDASSVQKPAGEAPATPDGEKPAETAVKTDEQPEKQGQSRFQRRLDRAYRRAAEAEGREKLLREQLEKFQPPASVDSGAPRLEQFDDIEKYATAREKYAAEKAVKDHEAKQRQQTAQAAQATLVSAWEEKATKGEDKYDDWHDVVGDVKPVAPFLAAAMRAENGHDILHHLGKSPNEVVRIARLDQISQGFEIGLLSAKFASEPPQAKTPSKAPPPPVPLTGKSAPASETPSEEDDMRTWIRKRNRQVHGK